MRNVEWRMRDDGERREERGDSPADEPNVECWLGYAIGLRRCWARPAGLDRAEEAGEARLAASAIGFAALADAEDNDP